MNPPVPLGFGLGIGQPGGARAAWGLVALVCAGAAMWLAALHPIAPHAAVAGVLVWSGAVWRWPWIWLAVLPMLLPVANFSPWTGWLMFDESDMLALGALAGGYGARAWHSGRAGVGSPEAPLGRTVTWLLVLMAASALGSLALGLAQAAHVSGGLFQGYTGPLNVLRVAKSMLFGLFLLPLLREQFSRARECSERLFGAGMCAGLFLAGAGVVWERAGFPGLTDFGLYYRATSTFWEMHLGGAALDAYLVLTLPFAFAMAMTARSVPRACVALPLLVLGGYACISTFSRGLYLALALAGLYVVLVRGRAATNPRPPRAWLNDAAWLVLAGGAMVAAFQFGAYAGGLALLALVAGLLPLARRYGPRPPVQGRAFLLALALLMENAAMLSGEAYLARRLTTLGNDIGHRTDHWRAGIALLKVPADWMVGLGAGRFPAQFQAREGNIVLPGGYEVLGANHQATDGFARLRGPLAAPKLEGEFALSQRIAVDTDTVYRVALDARSSWPTMINAQLCIRHLIYQAACASRWMAVPAGPWRRLEFELDGRQTASASGDVPQLGFFSLAVAKGGAVDVDKVVVLGRAGAPQLANGDFAKGGARWFPTGRYYYFPWHVDNLYLEILIERGLAGLLGFAALVGIALAGLTRPGARPRGFAGALAAALVGLCVIGAWGSVADAPRVMLVFWLVLWVSLLEGGEDSVATAARATSATLDAK